MRAILIAEDPEEREFLSYQLRQLGLTVVRTTASRLMDEPAETQPVDLLVLTGGPSPLLATVHQLRALSAAPLVLITDPLSENEHCALLDAGVDLVFMRPYAPRLFVRYLRRQLHRAGSLPLSTLVAIDTETIRLDPDTRRVTVLGQEAQDLTPLEFRLLHVLMTHPEQVIPVEMIIERVWGYSGEGSRELVRGLIRRLRRKIEPDSHDPHFIHNHPGIGYRFTTLME
jgi:DNA-binding response OmpR family regulator